MQFMKEMLHSAYVMKKAYDAMWDETTEKYGLTRVEIDVLAFLENNPERNAAHQIVEYRKIAKSHVSKAVDSLLARELLTAEKDANDRRCIHLTLTEKSREIVREIQGKQREYSNKLVGNMSEADLSTLLALMQKLVKNLSE